MGDSTIQQVRPGMAGAPATPPEKRPAIISENLRFLGYPGFKNDFYPSSPPNPSSGKTASPPEKPAPPSNGIYTRPDGSTGFKTW